jgi:hypothetical protein
MALALEVLSGDLLLAESVDVNDSCFSILPKSIIIYFILLISRSVKAQPLTLNQSFRFYLLSKKPRAHFHRTSKLDFFLPPGDRGPTFE